jgi:hypothetical protein
MHIQSQHFSRFVILVLKLKKLEATKLSISFTPHRNAYKANYTKTLSPWLQTKIQTGSGLMKQMLSYRTVSLAQTGICFGIHPITLKRSSHQSPASLISASTLIQDTYSEHVLTSWKVSSLTFFNLSLSRSVISTCFKQTNLVIAPKNTKVTCLNDYHIYNHEMLWKSGHLLPY